MTIEYKEFIGIYRNVFPKGYCQHLISEFDRLAEAGAGLNRQKTENASHHQKSDLHLHLNMPYESVANFNDKSIVNIFFNNLQRCYEEYLNNFSVLKDFNIRATSMKMQRTNPGGGYHLWHCEQGNGYHIDRTLVYMLYLNTLEEHEGGETEFLYQRLRLRPEENTMVVWPASFTHTHRGNTVLGDRSKYIVTGWFHYE